MKKTLIALAVAASAVSGMAHAWMNGDFTGLVNIGGTITADDYRQKWAWQTGNELANFSATLSKLTNSGTKLTLNVTSNSLILMGKTNEAFAASAESGVGAIPVISFSDYQNNPVQLTATGTAQQGVGTLTLPVKASDNDTVIGQAVVNVSYAGALLESKPNYTATLLRSVGLSDNASKSSIFKGGLLGSNQELNSGNAAAARVAEFGGPSANDLLTQVQVVHSNATSLKDNPNRAMGENMFHNDGTVLSASYAIGVASGQTIELTFNNALTQTTQWSAPLNIAITYD